MKIELTQFEYEMLKIFQQLTREEKIIVLSNQLPLSSAPKTLPSRLD